MSGLCKEDLHLGEGATAEPGDRCTVRFTGWLPGEREPFDSTPDASEPFVFRLQEGAAIQGFVEGIAGMRVGGRRRLLIPSALAYGEEGRDEVIPPGSDLIFEVELVCVVKRQSDTRRLLIAPQARVRWHGKTVELYVPGEPRTVESEDAQVLLVLHEFSIPSHPTEVAGRFPELPPESVEAAVDELEAAHVLIQEAGRTGEAPTELVQAASPPGADTILFVLPPNLSDYGHLDIPSAFLLLGSIAAREGFATDFLIASSTPGLSPSSTRVFSGPSAACSPAISFVRDFAFELMDRIVRLRQGGRLVLAMSCFSSALYPACMIVGALVRARFPDLPILVGGCHPTVAPDSLISVVGSQMGLLRDETQWRSLAGDLFATLDEATASIVARGDFVFDGVFTGRADESFVPTVRTLLQADKRAARPRTIPAAPMNDAKMADFRYHRGLLARLAQEHVAVGRGSPLRFPISFSLGCPYSCSFCINSMTHEPWQGMDVAHAIDTLEFLHLSFGIRHFSLMDANFAARTSWRRAFFAALADKPWLESIQIDTETAVMNWALDDYRILDRLSLTLQIGLESCAPEMLLAMDKCKSPAQYLDRLKQLIENLAPKVDHISLMLIFAYPGETHETLKQTLAYLIDECKILDYRNVEICPQLYLPLVGTSAFERTRAYADAFGYRPNQGEWWNREAADRFMGLRPSHSLSIETCLRLTHAIESYFRGAATEDSSEHAPGELTNMCATVNHSKLEQRKFRADLWDILERGR